VGKRRALVAIVVGGLTAGALDLAQAMTLFGARIPLVIAAGLLGRGALHGGPARTFWAYFCTSLSLARRRQFTTGQAARWAS
jgi:hypothetical protein